MDRVQKEELVNSLRETFNAANSVVVSHFKGLTAAEAAELRRKMREAGAQFRVTKNSLARRALDGTAFGGLEDLFEGPTGVACSKDPVAAAKASVEFAKDSDHLVILGGSLDGNRLSGDEVKALAALPSVDELRAQLVSLLKRPATNVVSVLAAPSSQLARVFGAYGNE